MYSDLYHNWFRWWLGACSAPSHYLKQCWFANWTLNNIIQWNLNQNNFNLIKCVWKCCLQNDCHFPGLCVLSFFCVTPSNDKLHIKQWAIWPWWQWWNLYTGTLSFWSSHFNSFEEWVPGDFLHMHPIFKWVTVTWTDGRVLGQYFHYSHQGSMLYSFWSSNHTHFTKCFDQVGANPIECDTDSTKMAMDGAKPSSWCLLCNTAVNWPPFQVKHFHMHFAGIKMYEFRLKLHWILLLRLELTIFQHWFNEWLGAEQVSSHYLNQWWLVYWCMYASLGLNELI